MGLNLRYSPIDWNSGTKSFQITGKIDGPVIDIPTAQNATPGWGSAALFKHGSYSGAAIAYGAVSADDLILQSVHISAVPVAQNVVGSVLRMDTAAAHSGYFTGILSYLTTSHNSGGAKALYGEVDITATAALAGNHQALFGEVCVTGGTITGAGKIEGLGITVSVTAGVTIAQTVIGAEIDMRGIKADIAGETIGIKVTMAGGSNYLDYGMQFSNCFNTATAVINFDLTQGATACVMLVESGAHTITNFIEMTGTVTNFAKLTAGVSGTHCFFTNAAVCAVATSHALQIMVGTTPHYIPVFSDLSWGSS